MDDARLFEPGVTCSSYLGFGSSRSTSNATPQRETSKACGEQGKATRFRSGNRRCPRVYNESCWRTAARTGSIAEMHFEVPAVRVWLWVKVRGGKRAVVCVSSEIDREYDLRG